MSDRVIARIVQDLHPTRELTRMRRRRRNRRVSIGPNIGRAVSAVQSFFARKAG